MNKVVGDAATAAKNLVSSTGSLANSLVSSATSTVDGMVNSVSNFASGLIGDAASSVINSVFPGKGGSGSSSIGGLFGSAI